MFQVCLPETQEQFHQYLLWTQDPTEDTNKNLGESHTDFFGGVIDSELLDSRT